MQLPRRYIDEIRQVRGVKVATWAKATPFRAQLQELGTMVLESFPWTLTPIA